MNRDELTTGQRAAAALEALEAEPKKGQGGHYSNHQLRSQCIAYGVGRTSFVKLQIIKNRDTALYAAVKAGALTLEEANRKLGLWKHRVKKRKAERAPKQSTEGRRECAAQIRLLADKGCPVKEIAKIVHRSRDTVRVIAKDYDILLPNSKPRTLSVSRMLDQIVLDVETTIHFASDYLDCLDHLKIPLWILQLQAAATTIDQLIATLKRKEIYEKSDSYEISIASH